MRISVLCSDSNHPVYAKLAEWVASRNGDHLTELVNISTSLSGGDILFLISCHEIIGREIRDRYGATLVVHASDLPNGRGWSPHIWQILAGENRIVVTLLEAADIPDTGDTWAQEIVLFAGHELCDEIYSKLFAAELRLMDWAVEHYGDVQPQPQPVGMATYFRKRTPADSRLHPEMSLAEQFNLLRVADSARFPAFFDFRGYRYYVTVTKQGIPGEGD